MTRSDDGNCSDTSDKSPALGEGTVESFALGDETLAALPSSLATDLLADRVVIISAGEIVAQGTPDTLAGRQSGTTTVRFQIESPANLPESVRGSATIDDGAVTIASADPTRTLYELTSWAVEKGVKLDALEVTRPTLEDVYLEITAGTERSSK